MIGRLGARGGHQVRWFSASSFHIYNDGAAVVKNIPYRDVSKGLTTASNPRCTLDVYFPSKHAHVSKLRNMLHALVPQPAREPCYAFTGGANVTNSRENDEGAGTLLHSETPVSSISHASAPGNGPVPTKLPIIFFVHGGAWVSGSRNFPPWFPHSWIARHLVSHNFVVVVPAYRLAPGFKFPAPVTDVAHALHWTYNHIHVSALFWCKSIGWLPTCELHGDHWHVVRTALSAVLLWVDGCSDCM